MKKIELLSPVGNMDTLRYAINGGCDAVYLGGKNFGARKYSNNFDNDEMRDAVLYAHLFGVRVYVTINTVIFDDEVEEFLDYVKYLHDINVDAFIMQDIGMIKLVRKHFPDMIIHASTQFHNYNNETLEYLSSIGVRRAVMARELSVLELKNITCDIEREVFIHGALCVCYSGCCLFSYTAGGRSGNRGECAGSCRQSYSLIKNEQEVVDNKYLLSPKELNTSSRIRELIEIGVDSLKIEGRMKSPYYVYYVTKLYRKLIDNYYNNEEMIITDQEYKNLSLLYNRDFTLGYLYDCYGKNYININSPKHQGVKIGEVIDVKDKIMIRLSDDLNQNDGIRFSYNDEGMIVNYLYNQDDLLINHASCGEIVYLDNRFKIKLPCDVYKTLDSKLESDIDKCQSRKIDVHYEVKAHVDEELMIKMIDIDGNEVCYTGNMVQKSLNKLINDEDISDKLSKLGNTVFNMIDIKIDRDQEIFISYTELNDARRYLGDLLKEKRENRKLDNFNLVSNNKINLSNEKTNNYYFMVRNKEQLEILLEYDYKIVTDDYLLYKEYKDRGVIYQLHRVNHDKRKFDCDNLLVNDIGNIYKSVNNNSLLGGLYLNITNAYSVRELLELGVGMVSLSYEMDYLKIFELMKEYQTLYNAIPNVGVMIYGNVDVMVSKHCILNNILNKDNKICNLCKTSNKYYLKDKFNNLYRIISNNCTNYIIDYKVRDNIDDINKYQNINVNNFILILLDEGKEEILNIIKRISKK